MKKKIELIMAVILLVSAGFLAKRGAIYVQQSKVAKTQTCIVIDAGHGGDDPGKIGINGEKEKELNLAIAKKLQKILEKKDYRIVLTRDSNKGLYHRTAHNKKVEDMKKRCEIINKEKPVFTISIHQNSYPEEYVKGAQVFYYGQSQEGKELAEVLQKSLVAELDKENHRTAKANESYYLLKYNRTDRKFETILQEEVNGNTSQGIRGIYIEDTLYVISGNIIEAYDMNTGVKSGDIIL